MIDPSKYKVHDLTRTYGESVAGYSDSPAKTLEKDGWNAKWLNIYSHAGTHMDAPFHFGVSNHTIDDYEPTSFMGKAWVVRLAITENKQLLTVQDLGNVSDKFVEGDSLLIQTNWSEQIDQPNYKDDLPRISKDLALWCVNKKVKILGVEPPSVADVTDLPEVTEIHNILLGGDVIIVEGLKNLDHIKKEEVFLMALPLKIQKGDGAPARVIAFEDL